MKHFILTIGVFTCFALSAQTYPNQNVNLVGHIHPNNGPNGIAQGGQRYSGCWAWHQADKNKEYAISGGSSGTYFIDITSPTTPSVSAYLPGKTSCVWREIKTYQNYCYIVSDDFGFNTFQIVDMQYLPDSVHVVHNGFNYFMRAHTIWIDQDKLYAGSVTYSNSAFTNMEVYSLATPSAPVSIRKLADDYGFIQHVHDMYVRNDTVYASCGYQGLYLFTLTASNTFSQVGSFTSYAPGTNYNHSSYLTQNGKYLLFCDEVPDARPIRIVDVQNFANISITSTFQPYPTTTAHNPYGIGDSIMVISSYQDGLLVYNIKDPFNPFLSGYFDTHPQGGAPVGTYSNSAYRGNWGAHVWLPSGLIVANDMQNGVFILDPLAAYSSTSAVTLPHSTVGLKKEAGNFHFRAFPNPASEGLTVYYTGSGTITFQVASIQGELVYEKKYQNSIEEKIDLSGFSPGTYLIRIRDNENAFVSKVLVER